MHGMKCNILPLWGHSVYQCLIREDAIFSFGNLDTLFHLIAITIKKTETSTSTCTNIKSQGKLLAMGKFEVWTANCMHKTIDVLLKTLVSEEHVHLNFIHTHMHNAQYAKACAYHVKYFNLHLSNSFLRMHEYKLWDYSINDFHHRLSYWFDWEGERERERLEEKLDFLLKQLSEKWVIKQIKIDKLEEL